MSKVLVKIVVIGAAILICVSAFVYALSNNLIFGDSPEEVLEEYTAYIEEGDYDAMYGLLSDKSKKAISQKEFVDKNANIYEGIEASNLKLVLGETKKINMVQNVRYSLGMETVAGDIAFDNTAAFVKNKDNEYRLEWSTKMIFPYLEQGQKVRVNTLKAKRGQILDRNGKVLAGAGTAASVGFVPGKMQEGSKVQDIAEAAKLLDISEESINKKLAAKWVKDDNFVPIKMISNKENDLKNKLLTIPGISISNTAVRYYPLGEKASHLTGYVQNINGEELEKLKDKGYNANSLLGKTGLERIYEDQLRGKDGVEIVIASQSGKRQETLTNIAKEDGQDLKLTIDANIQSKLYNQFSKDKSCSVAINPKTGAVLALVSTPSYDANDFVLGMSANKWDSLNKDKDRPLYNRFKAAHSPGSTMKSITAAIGIDSGAILPEEDFGRSGLKWRKDSSWGGYSITTLREYSGPANIENALVYSDNIFFGKAAMKIGGDTFAKELKAVGFEEKIPFEYGLYSSIVSNTESFSSEIQLADSGFGQGEILMNPVHMAVLYASFINEGNVPKPFLLEGRATEFWKKNAFSQKTAETIKNDLVQVIQRGTGEEAKISGKVIGGKTGTAEIKLSKDDTSGTELGWFVMFTAEDTKNPLLVISMAEDVKDRGGSHYVIPKVKTLFE